MDSKGRYFITYYSDERFVTGHFSKSSVDGSDVLFEYHEMNLHGSMILSFDYDANCDGGYIACGLLDGSIACYRVAQIHREPVQQFCEEM